MSTSAASTKRIPCDQCYERRVRCSGILGRPCDGCSKAQRVCTREKIRRKRGPIKSTAAKSDSARLKRAIGESGLSTSYSASEMMTDFPLSYTDDGGLDENDTATINSNAEPCDDATNRHPDLQHGRARVSVIGNSDDHFTVNELADFIMSEANITSSQPDLEWLLGLRNGAQGDYSVSSTTESNPASSVATTTRVANFSIYSGQAKHPSLSLSNQVISSDVQNAILDGTAIALATGMPLSYSFDMVQCVEIYFSEVYHVLPILHEYQFRRTLAVPSQLTITDRGLCLAVCAVTSLRCAQLLDGTIDQAKADRGQRYLEQLLKLRSDLEYSESSASATITSAFLIHITCASMGKVISACQYLREAIYKGMNTGLHNEGVTAAFDRIDTVYIQRTMALMFVTERATAIFENQDILSFRRPPHLPDASFNEQDRKTLTGFQCLFNLFVLLDDEVVDLWCSRTSTPSLDLEKIRVKLHSLQLKLSMLSFDQYDLNDFQKADILVTRLWIRLILWQIAMRLGFLSSLSENLAYSYTFPIWLAKDLCIVLQSLHRSALLVHHFSIYSKIFEIAYSLMDILMLSEEGKQGPGAEELKYLFGYLSTSPINRRTYYRVLMERNQKEGQHRSESLQKAG